MKLFLDGTNELGNSATLEPMLRHGRNDSCGEIQMGTDELADCLQTCNDADIDVHIHLVGDRAFRVACDAVQTARTHLSTSGESWRIQVTIAHCELIDPADMGRPEQLDIIVNWTPHWSGGYFGEQAKTHLGIERWNRMYDFNPVVRTGARVTFSSDVVTA